jgi:hypothetical protein
MKTEKVHISRIRAGDTIFHDGKDMTVSKKDIKRDAFMGISIFGDSYRLGTILISRVLFPVFFRGKLIPRG